MDHPLGEPVVISYNQLLDETQLYSEIERGFGYEGLGLIIVQGVPQFSELRQKLLPLSSKFAILPDDVKNKYVHERSHYSFGWSHGKEKLKKGQFDVHKGSYYNNPQYNIPTTKQKDIDQFPEVCSPNIWPNADLPEFESAFMNCGQLIVRVGTLLAKKCDQYIESKFGARYPKGCFASVIENSRTCKARLLHYFPLPEDDPIKPGTRPVDSWCGWHNDHSALTGLCPAIFRDVSKDEAISNPDANAGLYIKSRDGKTYQVRIPGDCIGFQIGETTQVFSGGLLRATPHAVRALSYPLSTKVCRDTFAVFMQPNFDFVLKPPEGVSVESVSVGQYNLGMDFGEFGKATIAHYYGADY